MKIQPIDIQTFEESVNFESPATVKPVLKSRLKRLFDRKNNSEKTYSEVKDVELEPSSVCLAKMVQNFIEDAVPEKPKCGRTRCNCFNGNINDISDDEFDLSTAGFFGYSTETLKSLTPCSSITQRNLLADTAKIIEKNKICKRKDELRKLVAEGLVLFGHDASICKSHWEKTSSYPAGEYEYIDVISEERDRIIIDIDFRSEFEIARPMGNYKAILQSLPYIFVGEADRLQQIISIVSEAATLSLKKKGMHVPPWRKFDYMKSKWLSSHIRIPSPLTVILPPFPSPMPPTPPPTPDGTAVPKQVFSEEAVESETRSLESSQGKGGDATGELLEIKSDDGFETSAVGTWQPPAIKPRNVERGSKLVVTGLASLFREKA
ncbi:uncharacterized protein [Rutidosis leptorrhynchoides]